MFVSICSGSVHLGVLRNVCGACVGLYLCVLSYVACYVELFLSPDFRPPIVVGLWGPFGSFNIE